jgi:hypothetical protein
MGSILWILASVFHFGLSSWLFLHLPKTGKIFSILTGTIMCIWPSAAFFGTLIQFVCFQTTIYFLPLAFTGVVFYNHIKTFHQNTRPNLTRRIILTALPPGLFVAYTVHIATMIQLGRITFGQ